MKIRMLPLLVLFSALALAGCTNVSEIIAAGLRTEVTRVEQKAEGVVEVTLRLHNPNIVPYLVDHYVHKVTLNGVLVGTVGGDTRTALPRESVAEQTGTLKFASPAAADQVRQLAGGGPVSYRVDSTVWLLLVDDDFEKVSFGGNGSVAVTSH